MAQNEARSGTQAERVKVYEEGKKKNPLWLWLLPMLLVLAVGIWMLTRHHTAPVGTTQSLGSVNFDTDQATLTPAAKGTLDHAVDQLKQKSNSKLRIQGYTDSTGDLAHNVALSNQRSLAVTQYLAAAGIDQSRLIAQGFGDSTPVASNATAAGKATNRRVVLFQE